MTKPKPQDLLASLISAARAAGADAADALYGENVATSVSYRLGKVEEVERAESADVGLRVLVGGKVAFVSTSDHSPASLAALPEKALVMARLATEDPYACLAEPELLARTFPDLNLADADEPSADVLVDRARTAEDAARAVEGVTNSEGASASFSRSMVALATSEGFYGSYDTTGHAVSISVLAGKGEGMERDYDFDSARHSADLDSPADIGARAGHRAVSRLHPRKIKSKPVPVVFAPRVSCSLLSHLIGAVSGAAIARSVSFLKDSLGQPVFSQGIQIVDDPHIERGLRSKPFDGEGVANPPLSVIEDGVLKTWLLDCASARQLGLTTNGRAARGTSGPPSPAASNLFLKPGPLPPEALISDVREGFYVVELMGMGVNPVTGDYSRGAAGFWIKNGQLVHPVSGVTVAGNLRDMFRTLMPANDLSFRYGIDAPTVRIEEMTVAGS